MQSTVQSVLNMKELRSESIATHDLPYQFLEFMGGFNLPQAFP